MTTDTHLHTNYIQNILQITEYIQSDEDARAIVLSILTERLVQLDAHIDKNDEDEVHFNLLFLCMHSVAIKYGILSSHSLDSYY